MSSELKIERIKILDGLNEQRKCAIEVDIHMSDGQHRWCWVTTPEALNHFGDQVVASGGRFHGGTSHFTVIAAPLSHDVILSVLDQITSNGELLRFTWDIHQDHG
ncbi:MAG: hypothetical protein ACRBB0_12440 [Pelagimonas sp.]|uniref:hypothetical protein n=1 Tax=Pelagimonas sp. TaxID=2073170 RepID=UPI003D6C2F6D